MTPHVAGIFSITEAGDKAINEDAFAVTSHPDDPTLQLLSLADGQGGQPRGREAAQLACESVTIECHSLSPKLLQDSRTWTALLTKVDQVVSQEPEAGRTTLIGLALTRDWLCGASSGDSSVLAVVGTETPTVLTQRQMKNPPVGSGGAIFVPFEMKLSKPWSVLIMSDGVWKYLGYETLIREVRQCRGQEGLEFLLEKARLPGSGRLQDDFTAILIQST